MQRLRDNHFDLVLINRKLDQDGSDGLEILRQVKADERLAPTPVMLITNFEEHQQLAIEHGAIRGFGKAHLHDAETQQRLRDVLQSRGAEEQRGKGAES